MSGTMLERPAMQSEARAVYPSISRIRFTISMTLTAQS